MTQKLSEILKEIVQKKAGSAQAIQRAADLEIWENVIQGRVKFPCRPARFERGILYLLVENPIVAQELSLQRSELIQELNERIGDGRIKDIRFKIGYEINKNE